MPQDIDPLLLRDRLRSTLARYIATAVPVSATRAPGLAAATRRALEDRSLQLTKGPFLESLPDFGKKGSIRELVDAGVLTDQWRALQETGFERLLDRPFHTHQERAIRQPPRAGTSSWLPERGQAKQNASCYPSWIGSCVTANWRSPESVR